MEDKITDLVPGDRPYRYPYQTKRNQRHWATFVRVKPGVLVEAMVVVYKKNSLPATIATTVFGCSSAKFPPSATKSFVATPSHAIWRFRYFSLHRRWSSRLASSLSAATDDRLSGPTNQVSGWSHVLLSCISSLRLRYPCVERERISRAIIGEKNIIARDVVTHGVA